MNKETDAFRCLREMVSAINTYRRYEIDKLITFSRLSNKKLRAGVFVGPDIRKLVSNSQFLDTLSGNERQSFDQLMVVVRKVLVPYDFNPERKKLYG